MKIVDYGKYSFKKFKNYTNRLDLNKRIKSYNYTKNMQQMHEDDLSSTINFKKWKAISNLRYLTLLKLR